MKKLLLIPLLFIASQVHADTSWMTPFVLLATPNVWTKTQTFKDIIITGTCTGCGSGGSGSSYPDWLVDQSFSGINAKGDSPLKFKNLNLDGDLYVLNLYTSPD